VSHRSKTMPSQRLLPPQPGSRRNLFELAQGGFAEDVAIAIELDDSKVVPILADGAFRNAL
jgi:phosphosulfolactate phosphohydrolase-like enzyme